MAGVSYDYFAGLGRLLEADERFDPDQVRILLYHSQIEREIDQVLRLSTGREPDPDKTTFAARIRLLAKQWRGDPAKGDLLIAVLRPFNRLRNAVAHDLPATRRDADLDELVAAYRAMVKDASEDLTIKEMAHGIVCFMGDEQTPREVAEIVAAFENLVIDGLPIVDPRAHPGDDYRAKS